jgi:hypothetical protein
MEYTIQVFVQKVSIRKPQIHENFNLMFILLKMLYKKSS